MIMSTTTTIPSHINQRVLSSSAAAASTTTTMIMATSVATSSSSSSSLTTTTTTTTTAASTATPVTIVSTMTAKQRAQERENLRNIIAQWNANRLDLFEISEPNEVRKI